jgi:DNA-binding beta-propeller fold protein YncE
LNVTVTKLTGAEPHDFRKMSHLAWPTLIATVGILPQLAFAQPPEHGASPVLRTVAEIPLPGAAVRFDYQNLDTLSNRLYIAHMDADQLVVVDIAKRTVIANLDGFDRVHGVITAPEVGRVYASVTGRHELAVVDARTLEVLARVGPISYPNGLAYAPDVGRVFVSDNGGTDAVVDAKTNRLITSIQLGAGAGNTVYDPTTHRILVAVHQMNELVTIDPSTTAITKRTPLPGIGNSHGVVLDPVHRLAFVAGTRNATVGVVDLTAMHLTHTYPVAADPDVLAYDPGWRRLYVSSESGGVTVLSEVDRPDGVELRRDGDLNMPHAHTVSVDPRTHLVYFPLQDLDGRPVLRIMAGSPPA